METKTIHVPLAIWTVVERIESALDQINELDFVSAEDSRADAQTLLSLSTKYRMLCMEHSAE